MRDCAKLQMRYKDVGQSLPEGARCKLTIRPLVVEREVGGGNITEIRLRRCSAQVKYKLMISKSILRYLANFYAFCRSFSKSVALRPPPVGMEDGRNTVEMDTSPISAKGCNT